MPRPLKIGTRSSLVLLLVTIALSLGAAEIFLRFFRPIVHRRIIPRAPEDAWRGLLHQPSSIPGLNYELAPDMEKLALGVNIRTNSHGMRDSEPAPDTGAPLCRIAALGDSATFGWAVPEHEAFPAVLERSLQEASTNPECRYDVLNFGVGGYATRDEALVLRHKALKWNPDLIVIGYVLNDPYHDSRQPLPSYFRPPRWWQHSHLLRLISKMYFSWELERYGDGDVLVYLHNHPDKWGSVLEAFADIQQVADEWEIPVILAIFPATPIGHWENYLYQDIHAQVSAAASGSGFHVVDLLEVLSAHAPEDVRISKYDDHPTPLGHSLAAGAIEEKILEASLLRCCQTSNMDR